jgi:hypothetical protein
MAAHCGEVVVVWFPNSRPLSIGLAGKGTLELSRAGWSSIGCDILKRVKRAAEKGMSWILFRAFPFDRQKKFPRKTV